MTTTILAPIAIDLGSKTTGFVTAAVALESQTLTAPFDASVIEINNATFVASMYERRTHRHARRNMKRRRLAKRLLEALLRDRFKVDPQQFTRRERERLRGLFNRRGYTFLGSEGENLPEQIEALVPILNQALEGSQLMPKGGFKSGQHLAAVLEEFGDKLPTLFRTEPILRSLSELKGMPSVAPAEVLALCSDPNPTTALCAQIDALKDRLGVKTDDPVAISAQERKLLGYYGIKTDGEVIRGSNRKRDGMIGKMPLFPLLCPRATTDAANSPDVDRIDEGFAALARLLDTIVNAVHTGHKPRAAYFKDIKREICTAHDDFFTLLAERMGVTPAAFARLVGHISNLQLRVLRKYFNAESFRQSDYWDEPRFARLFWRYVKAWRADTDTEKQKLYTLRNWGKANRCSHKYPGVLALWLEENPTLTIPPFEDQNNRRPPRCQSLSLTADGLQSKLPCWESILSVAVRKDAVFYADVKGPTPLGTQVRAFQRLLDRRQSHDPFQLRQRCRIVGFSKDPARTAREIELGYQESGLDIGIENYRRFLSFAAQYYDLCEEAARSSWFAATQPDGLLRICGAKVRLKRNDLGAILAQMFGVSAAFWSEDAIGAFKEFLKTQRVGRQGLASVLDACAKVKKKHGEEALAALIAMVERNPEADAEITELRRKSGEAAEMLCTFLRGRGLAPEQTPNPRRIASIFTLAQIHAHLFEDISGFSKACAQCNAENAHRSTIVTGSEAFARRLPALPVRPFNGIVRKLLTKTAATIANHLCSRLPGDASRVLLPIIIEQNSFEWATGIREFMPSDLRNKQTKQKKPSDLRQSKLELLINDSGGVCPYTGETLDDQGELDHIIPRSLTQDIRQTTINAAVNLIYCSRRGNAMKSNQIKRLEELHPNYLMKQFGTASVADIATTISNGLAAMPEYASDERAEAVRDFVTLSDGDRRIVKHALFIPNERAKVLRIWGRGTTTSRVNGTQDYLGHLVAEQIQRRIGAKATILPILLPMRADEVSIVRRYLAGKSFGHGLFGKTARQTLYSHAIDAFCALALAIETPLRRSFPRELKDAILAVRDLCNFSDERACEELRPKRLTVYRVGAGSALLPGRRHQKGLTKGTMYSSRFLPLLVTAEGRIGFGFAPDNYVELQERGRRNPPVDAKERLYLRLRPFLAGDVPTSFDEAVAAATSARGYRLWRIQAREVLDYLQAANRPNGVGPDVGLVRVFESLHYSTVKQKVTAELLNDSKLSKSLSFELRISFEGFGAASGQVTIPSAQLWQTLQAKYKHLPNPQEVLLKRFVKGRHAQSWPKRRITRKEFSLPLLDDPSGGIRIQSRHPLTGQTVWRTVAASPCYRGLWLKTDDQGVTLGDGAPLFDGERVHTVKGSTRPVDTSAGVLPIGARIELAPHTVIHINSESRGVAEVTFPLSELGEGFANLLDLFPSATIRSDENPLGRVRLPALKARILRHCKEALCGVRPRKERGGEFKLDLVSLDETRIVVAFKFEFNATINRTIAQEFQNTHTTQHAAHHNR